MGGPLQDAAVTAASGILFRVLLQLPGPFVGSMHWLHVQCFLDVGVDHGLLMAVQNSSVIWRHLQVGTHPVVTGRTVTEVDDPALIGTFISWFHIGQPQLVGDVAPSYLHHLHPGERVPCCMHVLHKGRSWRYFNDSQYNFVNSNATSLNHTFWSYFS